MRVADVMSAPVRTVAAAADAAAAWEQMRRGKVRHLVVTGSDGRVHGVLSATDLGGRFGEPVRSGRRVADLMTEKVVVATQQTTVREAANLMRGHCVNCLPVFEGQTLTGIVTVGDLLELLGRGAEKPSPRSQRWVLKNRGPKHRRRDRDRRVVKR